MAISREEIADIATRIADGVVTRLKEKAPELASEIATEWASLETTTIFFNVPEARDYLLKHGYAYTLRPKMRRTGKDLAVYGSYYKHETIGPVRVDFIKEIKEDTELGKYVQESGFLNVQDWLAAAEGSRFLFKVTIISKGGQ